MFDKSVYVKRRQTLLERMKNSAAEGRRGIALFIGNTEAPAQYKDNCYKFRQDSTWLYFFGIDAPLYAAVIDLDNEEETIFADDVEIGDIIWMGPQPSVASIAAGVGIEKSAPYKALDAVVGKAVAEGRPVHFIKPSRYYNTMKIASLIGCGDGEVAGKFSLALTKAIISMRLVKEDCEIRFSTMQLTSGMRCILSQGTASEQVFWSRKSSARWRLSPCRRVGAFHLPQFSHSMARHCITICMTRL